MSLTVPTSGSIAGRSADIRVAPDQSAEIVTRFAQQMAQVGIGLENDRLQRQSNRLGVDMARDFNNLSLELQQIGDPDQLDQMFQTRSAEIRQSYLSGTDENGRPRVDPRNAEQFGLAFDDLANRHAYSVGARALEARQSQREATWLQTRQTALNAAATGDEATSSFALETAVAQAYEMRDAGIISPAEAEARVQDLYGSSQNARAIQMVTNDPEGWQAARERGEFDYLGPEVAARYDVQAQGNIEARTVQEQRDMESAWSQRNKEIDDQLTNYQAIASSDGATLAIDQQFMADPAVQARPGFARTQAALDLRAEFGQINMMTRSQLQEAIAAEESRPIEFPWQAERQKILRDRLAAYDEGVRSDPVGFAAASGIPVPALDLTSGNFQQLQSQLGQRQAWAQQFAAEGYVSEAQTAALTATERLQLQALAAPGQPPEQRAQLVAAAYSSLRGTGTDTADGLFADPVTRFVGSQMIAGTPGIESMALLIFKGQDIIAAQGVQMPTRPDQLGAASSVIGTVFADLEGGPTAVAGLIEATNAAYAARMWGNNPERAANWSGQFGDINDRLYRQTLHEVLGGTGMFDGGAVTPARGGIQTLNGLATILPPGFNAEQVSEAMSVIANFDLPRGVGVLPTPDQITAASASFVERLARVSESGLPPISASSTQFQAQMKAGQYVIRAVPGESWSTTRYQLGRLDAATGEFRAFYDTEGRPWQFNLAALQNAVTP